MAELLAKLHKEQEAKPTQNPFSSQPLVSYYEGLLNSAIRATNLQAAFRIQPLLANELLNAGESQEGIAGIQCA